MSMLRLRRSTILADARLGRTQRIYDRGDRGGASVRTGASAPGIEAALAGAETVDDVDGVFREYLSKDQVPAYVKKNDWVPRRITGGGHTLDVLVMSDYGAVEDSDGVPFRIGKESQFFAQEYADAFGAILPSQKLLRLLEDSADVKIGFIPVQKGGGADDSVAAVIVANDKAIAALDKQGATDDDGLLKIGYGKAYVVRPGLNGDYIAIYGGRWTPAGGSVVQPTSGHAHTTGRISGTPNYSDYSHRIVLVSRKAKLDGEDVDLRKDVFGSDDPTIYGLVSDEGKFDPVFPNAGDSSIASFSVAPGEEEPAPEVSTSISAPPKGAIEGGASSSGALAGIGSFFSNMSTTKKVVLVAIGVVVVGGVALSTAA